MLSMHKILEHIKEVKLPQNRTRRSHFILPVGLEQGYRGQLRQKIQTQELKIKKVILLTWKKKSKVKIKTIN